MVFNAAQAAGSAHRHLKTECINAAVQHKRWQFNPSAEIGFQICFTIVMIFQSWFLITEIGSRSQYFAKVQFLFRYVVTIVLDKCIQGNKIDIEPIL